MPDRVSVPFCRHVGFGEKGQVDCCRAFGVSAVITKSAKTEFSEVSAVQVSGGNLPVGNATFLLHGNSKRLRTWEDGLFRIKIS